MILSVRYVHAPRRRRRCDHCGRSLGPHLYLYGAADAGTRPGPLRLCVACVTDDHPKIAAAMTCAAAKAAQVDAEARRLAAWNADRPLPTPPLTEEELPLWITSTRPT